MKCHILGFFWNVEKRAVPLLKIKTKDKESYFALKRNSIINVSEDYGKKCIGYYKDKKFFSCPKNNGISYGRQCKECLSSDALNTCARCNGENCLASDEIKKDCLSTTHFLYLALIGDEIKVGISRAGRYLRRWVEQGADYACIISSGNGMSIRREEALLSKSIRDRIKNCEKIKKLAVDNKKLLEDFLKSQGYSAPIINVRRYYEGIDSVPKEVVELKTLLSGRIVCAKGKILVLEIENKYYSYDLNNLIAREVDLTITHT